VRLVAGDCRRLQAAVGYSLIKPPQVVSRPVGWPVTIAAKPVSLGAR